MIVDGVVVHEIVVPHPPGRVWQALTDPAELATWLMPNNIEPSVGARFEFDATPAFDRWRCEVLELDEPNVLAWRWQGGPIANSVVRFTLEAVAGGTRLRVEHSGFEEAEHRDEFDRGWGGDKLPALRARLDGAVATPARRDGDGLWRVPGA